MSRFVRNESLRLVGRRDHRANGLPQPRVEFPTLLVEFLCLMAGMGCNVMPMLLLAGL